MKYYMYTCPIIFYSFATRSITYFHIIFLNISADANGRIALNMVLAKEVALVIRTSCRLSPYSLNIASSPRADAMRVEWYSVNPVASKMNIHFSPPLFSKTSL